MTPEEMEAMVDKVMEAVPTLPDNIVYAIVALEQKTGMAVTRSNLASAAETARFMRAVAGGEITREEHVPIRGDVKKEDLQ